MTKWLTTIIESLGTTLLVTGIIAILGVVAACLPVHPPSPPQWLVDWTSWLATAVGTVLGGGVLFNGARALRKLG